MTVMYKKCENSLGEFTVCQNEFLKAILKIGNYM